MNTQTPAAARPDRFVKMRFLPMLFSHDYVLAEHNIFTYAARYLTDYDGCEWTFVTLEDGGGFMQPEEGTCHFFNPDNNADMVVSAEAAGIIITAMVLNHRSWFYDRHDEPDLCEHYCARFRQLISYASSHPEYHAIYCAIH